MPDESSPSFYAPFSALAVVLVLFARAQPAPQAAPASPAAARFVNPGDFAIWSWH